MKFICEHPKPSKNYPIFIQRNPEGDIVRAYGSYVDDYLKIGEQQLHRKWLYDEFGNSIKDKNGRSEYEDTYTDHLWTHCEEVPQFIFEARLQPQDWYRGRSAAALWFKDLDDDTDNKYYVTLETAFQLFKEVCGGKIEMKDGGLFGLYTIIKRGANYIVYPYKEDGKSL